VLKEDPKTTSCVFDNNNFSLIILDPLEVLARNTGGQSRATPGSCPESRSPRLFAAAKGHNVSSTQPFLYID
jgi:hypothetical protein